MRTITVYIGAHGSDPNTRIVRTRSDDVHYPQGFTVNFLSFAGLANITTQAGIIYKKHVRKPTSLINDYVAKILQGKGTDYAALAYLAPNIFKEPIESEDESLRRMEIMMNEFMAMVELADISFSKTSPPQNFVNPFFEKRWWFDHNHRDDLRSPDSLRSMPARHLGFTAHNPILSINGLFILQTTDELHKLFSISDIRDQHKSVRGHPDIPSHLLRPDAITNKNLLTKENYINHWRGWIQAFDYSRVPDEDVIKIASVREAVMILQQMHDAFTADNYNYDYDDYDDDMVVTDSLLEAIPPIKVIKDSLDSISKKIIPLITSVRDSDKEVNVRRRAFNQVVNKANELEEQIEELKKHNPITRQGLKTIEDETSKLTKLDEVDLVRLQQELSEEKARAGNLKSELDLLKDEIITIVTDFIRDMLSSESYTDEVKTTIKNIIMRNKLKNILKIGILYKRLSLSQLVLFFRSLGYDIVNIVDPSCFVLKDATANQYHEIIDTQGDLVNDGHAMLDTEDQKIVKTIKEAKAAVDKKKGVYNKMEQTNGADTSKRPRTAAVASDVSSVAPSNKNNPPGGGSAKKYSRKRARSRTQKQKRYISRKNKQIKKYAKRHTMRNTRRNTSNKYSSL